MKKVIVLLMAVMVTAIMWAQAPQKMSYQAVIRNATNNPVVNTVVGMRISILQGSVNGTIVYAETQTPTTNTNGLVSLEIGDGTVVSGIFAKIDWANGIYFIKTETDPAGAADYSIIGTSQLLSVPYAMYAKNANMADGLSNNAAPTTAEVAPSNILAYSATLNNTVNGKGFSTAVTFDYGTSTSYGSSIIANPSPVTGNADVTVSANLTGLQSATKYHYRVKASNAVNVTYSPDMSFTTVISAPQLSTTAISSILAFSASTGGNISYDGGSAITARGVCWSTSTAPTVALTTKTIDGAGTGSFSSSLTGLTHGTKYYVRSYATNSVGTTYGTELSFTTQNGVITINSTAVTSILAFSASTGGNITADGGAPITARGVCYSTNTAPTTSNSTIVDGISGTGSFSSSLTGLTKATIYYVRAFATNAVGTSYGTQVSFTTQSGVVTLSTKAASSILTSSALTGGNITADGGAPITARGVCWSKSTAPTVALTTKTTDGIGTGSFSSNLTGLTELTRYYIRSYATNALGTFYGNEESFATPAENGCGAYIARDIWKKFMCYNLGANTGLDAMTYSEGINGDLYQWGRPTDGHEKRTSLTTSSLANSNTPGHANFITVSSSGLRDWRSGGGNDTRWTDATKAANDPCPTGYKLPTKVQWDGVIENNTLGVQESGIIFGTKLFLPNSGVRYDINGTSFLWVGTSGYYWSSTVSVTSYPYYLNIGNGANTSNGYGRAQGLSVRCVAE